MRVQCRPEALLVPPGGDEVSTAQPKPETVREFWAAAAKRWRSDTTSKGDSGFMRSCAWWLDALGILDHDAFMSRYTTTIRRVIYVPFEVGVPDERFDLWTQIEICAHEHEHVRQFDDDPAGFVPAYALDTARRADYEAEAYRVTAELRFWHYQRTPDAAAVGRQLVDGYGCTEADARYCEKFLRASYDTIHAGGLISPVSQWATAWLLEHAPGMHTPLVDMT